MWRLQFAQPELRTACGTQHTSISSSIGDGPLFSAVSPSSLPVPHRCTANTCCHHVSRFRNNATIVYAQADSAELATRSSAEEEGRSRRDEEEREDEGHSNASAARESNTVTSTSRSTPFFPSGSTACDACLLSFDDSGMAACRGAGTLVASSLLVEESSITLRRSCAEGVESARSSSSSHHLRQRRERMALTTRRLPRNAHTTHTLSKSKPTAYYVSSGDDDGDEEYEALEATDVHRSHLSRSRENGDEDDDDEASGPLLPLYTTHWEHTAHVVVDGTWGRLRRVLRRPFGSHEAVNGSGVGAYSSAASHHTALILADSALCVVDVVGNGNGAGQTLSPFSSPRQLSVPPPQLCIRDTALFLDGELCRKACAVDHWGCESSIVGFSDGLLGVVDWRDRQRTSQSHTSGLSLSLPTTFSSSSSSASLAGSHRRRGTAGVGSIAGHSHGIVACCAVEDSFRVVCSFGDPACSIAVVDLRMPNGCVSSQGRPSAKRARRSLPLPPSGQRSTATGYTITSVQRCTSRFGIIGLTDCRGQAVLTTIHALEAGSFTPTTDPATLNYQQESDDSDENNDSDEKNVNQGNLNRTWAPKRSSSSFFSAALPSLPSPREIAQRLAMQSWSGSSSARPVRGTSTAPATDATSVLSPTPASSLDVRGVFAGHSSPCFVRTQPGQTALTVSCVAHRIDTSEVVLSFPQNTAPRRGLLAVSALDDVVCVDTRAGCSAIFSIG